MNPEPAYGESLLWFLAWIAVALAIAVLAKLVWRGFNWIMDEVNQIDDDILPPTLRK